MNISAIVGVVTVVTAALSGYIYFDNIKQDVIVAQEESVELNLKNYQRILYSESTRYAEVAKYYYELRAERELSLAEENRLRIAEKQLERLSRELSSTLQ